MPLRQVGRTNCVFSSAGNKPSIRIQGVLEEFPELKGFDWPERGWKAELDSLLLQAGRFKPTKAPEGLAQSINKLTKLYPKTRPYDCFKTEEWSVETISSQIRQLLSTSVNPDSSPGVPLAMLASTNKKIIEDHSSTVVQAVLERIELLSKYDLSRRLSPEELIKEGLVDPVRVFVKNEPHTIAKIQDKRFRLISSVSLIDQLIERLIFGPQNNVEIARWSSIPSKPGMGLSLDSQRDLIWRDVYNHSQDYPAAEADISGFDWSVQSWELWSDLIIRIRCGGFNSSLRKLAIARWYCFMNSTFQLSNGFLLSQGLPGLMKSGSYCTSSTNSRIRVLMADLIGSNWCFAMGDDSVEGWVPMAREKYAELGHNCKDYKLCKTNVQGELASFDFCSHVINASSCWPTSWPKILYRYICSPNPQFDDLERELRNCPNWRRIKRVVRACSLQRSENKDGRQKREKSRQEESSQECDSPPSSQPYDGHIEEPGCSSRILGSYEWPPYSHGSEVYTYDACRVGLPSENWGGLQNPGF